MRLEWFKRRNYRHFDLPVNEAFAQQATRPEFVSRHSFSPLIHYTKIEKRYKKCAKTGVRTIEEKTRPIKYASHRDASILSYYAYRLNKLLGNYYDVNGITESVIAYRSLGKANYDFAAEVLSFAKTHSPVTILAFDVSGFFDNLNHDLLKQRFSTILEVSQLPDDWFKVFRFITRFHYVDRDTLKAHPMFGPRFGEKSLRRLASMAELKAEGVPIHPNLELVNGRRRGIPQGTPIREGLNKCLLHFSDAQGESALSALLTFSVTYSHRKWWHIPVPREPLINQRFLSAAASNLYMVKFDVEAHLYCKSIGALYRRYSDDILVICKSRDARKAKSRIVKLIGNEKLEIAQHKTEETYFDGNTLVDSAHKAAQYLGFTFYESGPAIRASSLSRQRRKMRRIIKRRSKQAEARIAAGQSDEVYTKQLYRRFTYLKVNDGTGTQTIRNFSSYGRRSAEAVGGGKKILRQVKRLERVALIELAKLKELRKRSNTN